MRSAESRGRPTDCDPKATRPPSSPTHRGLRTGSTVRTPAAKRDPFWTRTTLSKDLTVDRPTVRGKLSPTLTSLRISASGFSVTIECRSRLAKIDFTVASLRRIVHGWAVVILPSQRWTNFRSITPQTAAPAGGD
jgi:hypothetical protein